jgi:hypothetical protein
LFPLGQVVVTPAALELLSQEELSRALNRHRQGDWGECDRADAAANDQALVDGTRLLSVYRTPSGRTFWILTAADRSVTTLLLPEEY